jgi:putative transposase
VVAEAQRRAQTFADRYQRVDPAAVACLLHTSPELTCYLRFPTEHWSRIRHSNLIERTFGETRRRTKVIRVAVFRGHHASCRPADK